MLVSEILKTLPASLEWMVLFNLSAIRSLTDDTIVKAMYHLPEETNLSSYSHVVLANTGRFLASAARSRMVEATSGRGWSRDRIRHSLADRFSDRLALFAVDEADCLGLGESGGYPPVLLHVKIQAGYGHAQAIFEQEPSKQHYELLQAVGVQFLGGESQDDYYLARFQNRLPIHIHTGFLSHFSRTAHCNLFFLQQGYIDPPLEAGLVKASEVRTAWARRRSTAALIKLAEAACERSFPMICQPPPPNPAFGYGDLVPLGFVLSALKAATSSATDSNSAQEAELIHSATQTCETLNQLLLNQQQDDLWAFHMGRLVTATDSALVLLGFVQPGCNSAEQSDSSSIRTRKQHSPEIIRAMAALESFADGIGGYYPQLWSTQSQPGKMKFDESCRHWCQFDYATTCLIRALRQAAGLDVKTSTDFLAAGMAHRSGLYFANPYWVDWMLACAIRQDEAAGDLRQQLLTEVLASMNEDFSFGTYDVGLSTALAILTLSNLGYQGRTLRAVQLRLLSVMDEQGRYPVTIPFYSSLRIDHEISSIELLERSLMNTFAKDSTSATAAPPQRQIRRIHEQHHAISLYQDVHCFISTAIAVLALSQPCNPAQWDLFDRSSSTEAHPRYTCANHCEYIAKFALQPYVPKPQLSGVGS